MPKIRKVPFQFTNEVKNGKHILTLSGNVQKKYWREDDVINAKDIREALDAVTEDILIRLNSPGGDVFEGVEIYNYLKSHSSDITVEVTGLAASAATFILAGADHVVMNVGTSLMIHEAATFTWGNKQEIQKTLNALETIDESILSIYENQTGQSQDQLKTWMEEEKWFTADEAVEFGFAESINKKLDSEPKEDIEAMIQNAVATAMASFTASHSSIDQKQKDTATNKQKPKSLVDRLKKGE